MFEFLSTNVEYVSTGRRAVLVDVENLVGNSALTASEVRVSAQSLEPLLGPLRDTQVIIGVSHHNLLASKVGWSVSHPRFVVRSGCDGADLVLLDVIAEENLSKRFEEVVLVSGDHVFTGAVVRLGTEGVRVDVVAGRSSCSKTLRMASFRTFLFDSGANAEQDVA
ncbi:MAG: NYN domain-containing protein [Actinomycetaceae bacterium]|nr:NYN domain-containing protein [Actinomycetaceae bacterium]